MFKILDQVEITQPGNRLEGESGIIVAIDAFQCLICVIPERVFLNWSGIIKMDLN